MNAESLQELEAQRIALEQRIEKVRKTERNSKLKEIMQMMELFGISLEDLTEALKKKEQSKVKRNFAAKYQNPETKETWSGLGKQPTWVKKVLADGKSLDDFLIKPLK